MSESLQLPTLSPPLPACDEGGLVSDQSISKVGVANNLVSGAQKAGNGVAAATAVTSTSAAMMMSENDGTMVNSNCQNDETKASMNSTNGLDINDDTLSSNILPQMNVYILDDTPSVVSQPPLPVTPVKDVCAGLESEPYSGLLRTSPYKEPDTTLSLDKEEPVSDLDKSPPSDQDRRGSSYESNHHHHHHHHGNNPLLMISARADHLDNHHHHDNDDDDDSSNDDSSYFASHLPEPNSGRRYSWASNASQNSTTLPAPQILSQQHTAGAQTNAASSSPRRKQNIHGRESDASLSLSDDSDDNIHGQRHPPVMFGPQPGVHPHNPQYYPQQQYNYYQTAQQQQNTYPFQPSQHQQSANFQPLHNQPPPPLHQFMMPPPRMGGGVPELYPEQIMPRMHSVNSLASTSSHNSSGSDTSIQDELQNVVTSQQQRRLLNRESSNNSHLPSGRRSPILGEHPPSRGASHHLALPPFGSPSSVNLQPSPPMILHSFSAGTAANFNVGLSTNDGTVALPHPQPHSMTPEELASWTAAATQSHPKYDNPNQRLMLFGDQPPSSTIHGGASSFPSISGSRGESDFAYSGDSDSNIHHQQQQQRQQQQQQQQQQFKHAFGEPNRGKTSMSNDEHNVRSLSWDQSRGHGPLDGGGSGGFGAESTNAVSEENRGFKVYWQRWIMLMVRCLMRLVP